MSLTAAAVPRGLAARTASLALPAATHLIAAPVRALSDCDERAPSGDLGTAVETDSQNGF